MAWRNSQKAAPEEPPFYLKSMEPTECPEGAEGDWFSYVIEQGSNQITGMRAGQESVIRRELGEMIERLNERRVGKSRSKTKSTAAKSTVKSAAESDDAVGSQESEAREASDDDAPEGDELDAEESASSPDEI